MTEPTNVSSRIDAATERFRKDRSITSRLPINSPKAKKALRELLQTTREVIQSSRIEGGRMSVTS